MVIWGHLTVTHLGPLHRQACQGVETKHNSKKDPRITNNWKVLGILHTGEHLLVEIATSCIELK